ncbi:MAG: VWA domain-containing protein [Phycisphaerales bacterium]|nr:VWA domain-containing protein [Phycisphaerales bacterium]
MTQRDCAIVLTLLALASCRATTPAEDKVAGPQPQPASTAVASSGWDTQAAAVTAPQARSTRQAGPASGAGRPRAGQGPRAGGAATQRPGGGGSAAQGQPSAGAASGQGQSSGGAAAGQGSQGQSSGGAASGQSSAGAASGQSSAGAASRPGGQNPGGQGQGGQCSPGGEGQSGQGQAGQGQSGQGQSGQGQSGQGQSGQGQAGQGAAAPRGGGSSGAGRGSPAGGGLEVLTTPESARISGASRDAGGADTASPDTAGDGPGASERSLLGLAPSTAAPDAQSSAAAAWAVRPDASPGEDADAEDGDTEKAGGGGGGSGAATGDGRLRGGAGAAGGSGEGEASGEQRSTRRPEASPDQAATTRKQGGAATAEAAEGAAVEHGGGAEGVTPGEPQAGPPQQRRGDAAPPGRGAESSTPGETESEAAPARPEPTGQRPAGAPEPPESPDSQAAAPRQDEAPDPAAILKAFREAASLGDRPAEASPDEATPPWHREVRGTWELVSRPSPARDFLPSGSDTRIIGIDPDGRTMEVVLAWDGAAGVSVAASYDVGFRPEVVEVDHPRGAAAFGNSRPLGLAAGHDYRPGAAVVPVEVPWSREGDALHLGGCIYRPVDPHVLTAALDQPSAEASSDVIRAKPGGGTDARTVDFFGLQAEGRYICYVIDVSGSMGPSGGLVRLQAELEQSLAALPAGTRFAVLPFNHELRRLQPTWARAAASSVRRVGARLAAVGADGGTDPSEAFEWAFRNLDPRPDVIFFMTDGKLNDSASVASRLLQLNAGRPRTRIHAIGLGAEVDEAFLDQISSDHGGQLRLVR